MTVRAQYLQPGVTTQETYKYLQNNIKSNNLNNTEVKQTNFVENNAALVAIENITIIILAEYRPPYLLFNNNPLSENTALILYENFDNFLSSSSTNQTIPQKILNENYNENEIKNREFNFEELKLKLLSSSVIYSELIFSNKGLQIFGNDAEAGNVFYFFRFFLLFI